MDCYTPGRLIVGPSPDGPDLAAVAREFGVRIDHSIVDRLKATFEGRLPESLVGQLREMPSLLMVPEGEEGEIMKRMISSQMVRSAFPDFTIRPAADVVPDQAAIEAAIEYCSAEPVDPTCGSGCKVAIIDSGIDASLLIPQTSVLGQYDARQPSHTLSPLQDTQAHGSLVAHIINAISPGAELVSIKAISGSGSVMDLLTALAIAAAEGCDLINVSLSVQCGSVKCKACGTYHSTVGEDQLALQISSFMKANPGSLLIGAAGNGTGKRQIALPARVNGVVAVGSFDHLNGCPDPDATYDNVPGDRFILAPGGSPTLADRHAYGMTTPMCGTSFATAFVTGVAARLICGAKGGPCGTQTGTGGTLKALRRAANRFAGYDQTQHGLGVLRYA